MWNESIGKKLHTLKLYVKVILMSDKSQKFRKIKELQFNGMADCVVIPQQFSLPLTRIVDFVDFLVRSPYPKPFN